jgi:hypothetical protein
VEVQEDARYGIVSRSPPAHPTLSCVEDQEAARYGIVSRSPPAPPTLICMEDPEASIFDANIIPRRRPELL